MQVAYSLDLSLKCPDSLGFQLISRIEVYVADSSVIKTEADIRRPAGQQQGTTPSGEILHTSLQRIHRTAPGALLAGKVMRIQAQFKRAFTPGIVLAILAVQVISPTSSKYYVWQMQYYTSTSAVDNLVACGTIKCPLDTADPNGGAPQPVTGGGDTTQPVTGGGDSTQPVTSGGATQTTTTTKTSVDGTICAAETTCLACITPKTYWWTKGGDACGTEPKLADGATCTEGTTCKACAKDATQWSDGFKCGVEPSTDIVLRAPLANGHIGGGGSWTRFSELVSGPVLQTDYDPATRTFNRQLVVQITYKFKVTNTTTATSQVNMGVNGVHRFFSPPSTGFTPDVAFPFEFTLTRRVTTGDVFPDAEWGWGGTVNIAAGATATMRIVHETPKFTSATTIAADFNSTYDWTTDIGWAVQTSSVNDGGRVGYTALDKNTGDDGWLSGQNTFAWDTTGHARNSSGEWISVTFPEKVQLQSFHMVPTRFWTDFPREFTIEGSNDGLTWTLMKAYVDIPIAS